MTKFGKKIKKLRKEKGMTQGQLAGKLNVSRQAVCLWETDRRELRVSMLRKVAKILKISADRLMQINDDQFNQKEARVMKQKSTKTKKGNIVENQDRMKKNRFQISAPEASSVLLTGDFSGWDSSGIPMKRSKKGTWKTEVNLKPGRYEYKFIVDGQWWTDPLNDNIITNSLGSQNSVIEI